MRGGDGPGRLDRELAYLDYRIGAAYGTVETAYALDLHEFHKEEAFRRLEHLVETREALRREWTAPVPTTRSAPAPWDAPPGLPGASPEPNARPAVATLPSPAANATVGRFLDIRGGARERL